MSHKRSYKRRSLRSPKKSKAGYKDSRRKSFSESSKHSNNLIQLENKPVVERIFSYFRTDSHEKYKLVIFDNVVHLFENYFQVESGTEHDGKIITKELQKILTPEYKKEWGEEAEVPLDKFINSWYVYKIFFGSDKEDTKKLIEKFGAKFSYLNENYYKYSEQGDSLLFEINQKENIYLFIEQNLVYYFKPLSKIINFFPYVFTTAHITQPIAIDEMGNIYYLSNYYTSAPNTSINKSIYLYSEIENSNFSSVDYYDYNKYIYNKTISEYFPNIKYLKIKDTNSFFSNLFNTKKINKIKDVLDFLKTIQYGKKIIIVFTNGEEPDSRTAEKEITDYDYLNNIYKFLKDKLAKVIPINIIKDLPKESDKIELEKLVKIIIWSPWEEVQKKNMEKLDEFMKDKKHLKKYLEKLYSYYKNLKRQTKIIE